MLPRGFSREGVNPDERGARRRKKKRWKKKKRKGSNTELGDISIERTKPINSAIILAVAPTRNRHPFSIYIETSCHVRVSRHIYIRGGPKAVRRDNGVRVLRKVSSAARINFRLIPRLANVSSTMDSTVADTRADSSMHLLNINPSTSKIILANWHN